jgi:hypothetical protein
LIFRLPAPPWRGRRTVPRDLNKICRTLFARLKFIFAMLLASVVRHCAFPLRQPRRQSIRTGWTGPATNQGMVATGIVSRPHLISLEEAMKTIVPALVVLALAVVPAHARKAQQGVSLNGVNLNGVSLNGSINGVNLNGVSLNGSMNGLSLNGAMNGVQLNGVVHQGLGNGTTAGLIGSATLIEVELPR